MEINALPQDVQKLLLEQLGNAGSSQHTGLTEKSHVAYSIPLPKLENATRGKVINKIPAGAQRIPSYRSCQSRYN